MFKEMVNVCEGLIHKFIQPELVRKLLRKSENVVINNIHTQFKHIGVNHTFPIVYYINNPKYICIGDNFGAWYNLRIEAIDEYMEKKFYPSVTIGDNVNIGADCHIGCINKVTIGNNVLIAGRVFITDHFHGRIDREDVGCSPTKRELFSKGPVVIMDNVWIGEGVCIMPGVTIGANSIIGANSVVTKNFDQNSVLAGNPAKLIKMLQ